jgi:hypothetical protein
MSSRWQSLKHPLRLVAGIPPWGPSDEELDEVVQDILRIWRTRTPTMSDWIAAARRHVRGAGAYGYHGENMADLNALLLRIQNTRPPGPSGPVRK